MRIKLHGDDHGKRGTINTGRGEYLAYAQKRKMGLSRNCRTFMWVGEINGHYGYPADSAKAAVENTAERFGF